MGCSSRGGGLTCVCLPGRVRVRLVCMVGKGCPSGLSAWLGRGDHLVGLLPVASRVVPRSLNRWWCMTTAFRQCKPFNYKLASYPHRTPGRETTHNLPLSTPTQPSAGQRPLCGPPSWAPAGSLAVSLSRSPEGRGRQGGCELWWGKPRSLRDRVWGQVLPLQACPGVSLASLGCHPVLGEGLSVFQSWWRAGGWQRGAGRGDGC